MKIKYIVLIILLSLSILVSFSSNAIDKKLKVTGAVVIGLTMIGSGIYYVTSKNSEKKAEEKNNTPQNPKADNMPVNKKNNKSPEKPDNPNVKMLVNGQHDLETVIWGIENDFGTKKLYEALPFEGYLVSSKVSSDTLKKPFYLAYVRDNSGALSQKQPEPDKFKDKFDQANGSKIVSFDSNSGSSSSRLISPTPDNSKDYTTVYRFSHNAPEAVKKALFKRVAADMKSVTNSNEERYFNTHGHDVGWLHVREDKTPKYYDKTMKEACKISE